jgi:uncharacterized protein YbjT (DUF2867 family)
MIAITGATGQTGSKIANLLLEKGKKIRVIGRSAEKLGWLKEKGAEVVVGDQGDVSFLTKAFSGSDAVYLLIPPKMDAPSVRDHYKELGDVAVEAIRKSGVQKVVFLSSLGAELDSGSGPIVGLHDVEAKLGKLKNVDVAILRAGYFMENTLMTASMIKSQHINGNATPPDAPVAMIATKDIAKKAAELLSIPSFTGQTIIDLFGDRISYREATRHIGKAIGSPDLPYVQFSDIDALNGMTGMGLSEDLARSFVELSAAIGKGLIQPTRIDPLTPNTSTTFKEFVRDIYEPAFKQAA